MARVGCLGSPPGPNLKKKKKKKKKTKKKNCFRQ